MHSMFLLPLALFACIFMVEGFYEWEDEYGTCTASGDPHYKPFDGGVIHFQGTCRYLLTGTCNCSKVSDAFKVFVENRPTSPGSTVSRTRLVDIYIHGYIVRFEEEPIGTGTVMIWDPSNMLVAFGVGPFTFNDVTVTQSGTTMTLTQIDGIIVEYSFLHKVSVTVPCKYKDELCGLCGNYNDVMDDQVLSDGTSSTSHTAIGNSWQVEPVPTSPLDEKCYQQQTGGNDYKPRAIVNPWCQAIQRARCPRSEESAEACQYDVDRQQRNPLAHCLELEAYVDGCPAGLFPENWRELSKCHPCPDGSYQNPCQVCPDGTQPPCSIAAADAFQIKTRGRRSTSD